MLCLLLSVMCLASLSSTASGGDYREAVKKYDGMLETGGYNRGPFIDSANREAGVPLGSPYCASTMRKIMKAQMLTTRTKMTARAKDYVGPHSIRAVDVWLGKAKVPDDCAGIMTRQGGGHIYFKISLNKDRMRCFDLNSTPDGLKGSQYDGRWSGYKTRSIKQTCSPLNVFRTVAFTEIFQSS